MLPCFFGKVLTEIPEAVCYFLKFIIRYPVKLCLGHIPSGVQQFPDASGCILPGDQHGGAALRAVPGGEADTLGVVPDGILSVVQIEPRAVLAVMLHQEAGGICKGLVFHKVPTDNQAAVPVVGSDTEGLVDHLLWIAHTIGHGLLLCLLFRCGEVCEIKQGQLLSLLCFQPLAVPVYVVFAFVDDLRGQLRYDLP